MSALQYVFGAVLIILAIFLIIVVLLQESRSAGLSGAISGGADTFFGKSKGRTMEQKLVKLTRISAIVFFILTLGITIFFMFKY
ncbi:MAG: preprotein translocase subunit SecG [Acutalibacteraceae bacterium]|jgi:preprotein translocase subunit SecG|nr:preprotein translocase subunit SecG [Oscillospiraceae bacterium]MEE0444163.1 preprotein translocase subunit SecG [Acutalibacteraceae bacterium]CDA20649.1 preprotein translocase SecG subunit [Ruminococcus sp. CAG:488]